MAPWTVWTAVTSPAPVLVLPVMTVSITVIAIIIIIIIAIIIIVIIMTTWWQSDCSRGSTELEEGVVPQ